MPPFDAVESACIGFFFGAAISFLIVDEYYQAKIRAMLDKLEDIL